MFTDLNRSEIIGNITNDLNLRTTGTGTSVLSFGVATNRRYKSQNSDEWQEETNFHNVVVWGRQAENLAQRARKGTRLYISGRLTTRSWDDQEGKKNYKTEIVAETISLISRYEQGPAGSSEYDKSTPSKSKSTPSSASNAEEIIDPDDLPF
jgi:single-strand DNA-binding protein